MNTAKTFTAAITMLIFSSPAGAKEKASSNVSFGVSQPLLVLTVDNEGVEELNGEIHEITYQPKVPTIGTVAASYSSLSLSYSHNLDGDSGSDLGYTDYKIGLFFESWGIAAGYTEFKRFRILDSQGFDHELSEKEAERLKMKSRLMAGDIYYFPLTLNYKLDAATDPAKRKSTGIGLGVIGSYVESDIDTPGGLVPTDWQAAFGKDGEFDNGTLTSKNLQAALGFVLAPGPFYLSALVAIGSGQQSFTYRTMTEERQGNGIAEKEVYKAAIGYAADYSFMAAQYEAESSRFILKHMSIDAERSNLSAVFGVKF